MARVFNGLILGVQNRPVSARFFSIGNARSVRSQTDRRYGEPVVGWRFHSRRRLVLQDIVQLDRNHCRVRVPLSGRAPPLLGEQKGAETSVVL